MCSTPLIQGVNPFSNNISLYQVFEIWYYYIIACDMNLGVSHIYNEFGI